MENKEEYLKLLNDVANMERTPDPEPSITFYSREMKEGFENALNQKTDSSEVILPKAPNRKTRRLLWKQDEKFRKRFKNELQFLEKYVEDNGLEELSKYLEEKNKDGNKSI
jgi:hypothetical protein